MELLTTRLRLEPLERRHASLLFEGLQSESLYEYIAAPPPASVEALRERYTRLELRRSPDGAERWLNWALFCAPEQRYIGFVQATVREGGVATIAYVLFADAWGAGYASEAVTRMMEHLIADEGALELRATVDVRNRRSIALLERLGFELVGVRKDAERIRDQLTDEAEYRRRPARGEAPA